MFNWKSIGTCALVAATGVTATAVAAQSNDYYRDRTVELNGYSVDKNEAYALAIQAVNRRADADCRSKWDEVVGHKETGSRRGGTNNGLWVVSVKLVYRCR